MTQGVIASTYEQQRNQHNESSTLPNTKEISHLLSLLIKDGIIVQPQDTVQLVSVQPSMEGIKLRSNAKDETELESFSVWSDQYQKGAIIIDASPMVNSGNIRPAEPDDMRGKNRLYFTISSNDNGIPVIVILGCHGDKESYQTEFLKAIGRN